MKKLQVNFVYLISFLFFIMFLASSVSCSSLMHGRKDAVNQKQEFNNQTSQRTLQKADEVLQNTDGGQGKRRVSKKVQINKLAASLNKLEVRMESQEDSIQRIEKEINFLKRGHKRPSIKKTSHKIIPESVRINNSSINTGSHAGLNYSAYTKPEKLYKKARSLLLEEDFNQAAILFTRFIKQYPDNELSDNSFYWLGECHYSMADYKGAVKIFKRLVKIYPKGRKVPDALLKTAYAYIALDDSDRANYFLKQVVTKYPFTDAGEKAAIKLKAFQ